MSYKTKPQIKLYKYENNSFVLQAIIDDFQECSFEDNLYEAGTFTISINYNIPNALKFERGLFVQFGNDSKKFGEILSISDAVGQDGKGSQIRTITGYDARYILKRRVIKNMNSNGLWTMTDKGEIVLRNLIKDQCGSNAETKRQLPITNTIPNSEAAIGKEYSVSESFSNLYEVCKTIATQSEIGWRIEFDGTSLNLVCYLGTDRSQTVRFDTDYESLANGTFTDSSEAFSNAIYVGGKGQNDDRDIYEGEDAIGGNSPAGLDRFECWDNQSSMTTESEYEAEALSMLSQYGQTITLSGNGLAKCPYVYEEQYFVGDKITVAFSGKSAVVQILSVTEHWVFGAYDISFNFGKPQPGLDSQLQLILNQIQRASNKTNSKDSVRWYTIPTDTAMPPSDVTYSTIGFIGDVGNDGKTFTLYRDASGTGSKTYHVYFKQLAGSGKLILTTGVSGASNLVLNSGTYVAIIYVDENGNVTSQGATPTSTITSGNNQPATSSGVAGAISSEATARDTAISNALALPTDAVLHYSFDEVPDYPDGTADVRLLDNNTYDIQSTNYQFKVNNNATISNQNGNVKIEITGAGSSGVYITNSYITGKILKIKLNVTSVVGTINVDNENGIHVLSITQAGIYEVSFLHTSNTQYPNFYIFCQGEGNSCTFTVEQIYIGDGSYSTPIINNANGQYNSTSQSGVAVSGVSGKGLKQFAGQTVNIGNFNLNDDFTVSVWVNPADDTSSLVGNILNKTYHFALQNGPNKINVLIYQNGSYGTYQTTVNVLEKNKWTHVVVVKNGTSVILYLNGNSVWTTTKSTTSIDKNSNYLLIGTTTNTRPQSYDDLLIFNRALSDTEVQALYLNKANTPKYYSWADWKLSTL